MIGNSRWHWAERDNGSWQYSHTNPDPQKAKGPLSAWAAVGHIPNDINLDPANLMKLKDVPLQKSPPWLGIDRALGSWSAFLKSQKAGNKSNGFLVVDAGTVLSITRVTSQGEFNGGQLVGGLSLQLSAMEYGTKYLKNPGLKEVINNPFPMSTADAMRRGAIQALIGVVVEAQSLSRLPIWLCGGDAPMFAKELSKKGIEVNHYPNLVLEGMVDVLERIRQD